MIELLGALAVIVLLGAYATQHLITGMRDEARRAEQVSLLNMSEALKTAVARNRAVPTVNGLPEAIALELELPPGRVAANSQGYNRRILLDPALRLGTNASLTVPYTQTAAGSVEPINPRAVIVTCLTENTDQELGFDDFWDLPEGEAPEDWEVDPEDLFIQRLDLRGIFHRVVLSNMDRDQEGLYEMDDSALQRLPSLGRREAWFLDGTAITFYYASGDLQAREFIHEDVSYVHEFGRWGRHVLYGQRPPQGPFGALVDAFLNAPPPTDPKFGSTQQAVVDEFYEYMWTYAIWAMGSPPLIQSFEKGGTTSDTQVPPFRILNDCDARMAAFTNNLID